LLAAKWQYTQFIPKPCTCFGWGNLMGCTGLYPCGDDAPW
jgi:hypothetical protein